LIRIFHFIHVLLREGIIGVAIRYYKL